MISDESHRQLALEPGRPILVHGSPLSEVSVTVHGRATVHGTGGTSYELPADRPVRLSGFVVLEAQEPGVAVQYHAISRSEAYEV